MTLPAIHELLKSESLFGCSPAFARTLCELIGGHHGAVEPVDAPAAPYSANHADEVSRNFCHDIGNKEFWQSVHIRRTGRRVVHSQLRHHSLSGKSLVNKSLVSREEYAVSGIGHKTQCNHSIHYLVAPEPLVVHFRSDGGTRLCTME